MGQWLKQSTAVTLKMGPFLDATDGVTAETALTLSQADVRLSKNGGDFAQKNESSSATHDENGYYDVAINTTDTDTLGRLTVAVSESGALPVWQEFMVVPANVWDSMFGSDKLQVDAVEVSSDSAAADALELLVENCKGTDHKVLISADAQALAATLSVNAGAISGDATAADNLETMLDGTGGQTLKCTIDGSLSGTIEKIMHTGTAQAGGASTITLATTAASTDDYYNLGMVAIVAGTGAGQRRTISAYVGSTRVATVSVAWGTQPGATSIYKVFDAGISAAEVNAQVDTALTDINLDHLAFAGAYDESDIADDSAMAKLACKLATATWTGYDPTTDSLQAIRDQMDKVMHDGIAQAGGASTITLASTAAATNDYYNGAMVAIVAGTGVGQRRTISDYVGSTRVATVSVAWVTQPDATSIYKVFDAGISAAEVNAQADAALVDYDGPTDTEMIAGFAALNDLSAADVNAQVDQALVDIGLDHLVAAAVAGADVVDNSIFARLASKSATADWDTFAHTTDSLEAIRDQMDKVMHDGIAQAGGASTITLASTAAATNDYYNGAMVAIVAGTGVGQRRTISDYVGSTRVATVSVAWVTQPDATSIYKVFDAGISAAEVNAQADAALVDYDGPTDAEMIADFAALNDLSAADVNAQVDQALVDIGLDHLLAASVAGTDVVDNSIFARLASKSATADWDTFAHTTDSLEAIRDRGDAAWGGGGSETTLHTGTAQAGGANTITLAVGAVATNDYYNNGIVAITSGTGAGQSQIIEDYTGATLVAQVSVNWAVQPDATSAYKIFPFGSVPGATAPTAGQVADAVWDELVAGHQAAATFGREAHLCRGVLANKLIQVAADLETVYYDNDGTTPLITHIPTTDEELGTITRTPS